MQPPEAVVEMLRPAVGASVQKLQPFIDVAVGWVLSDSNPSAIWAVIPFL